MAFPCDCGFLAIGKQGSMDKNTGQVEAGPFNDVGSPNIKSQGIPLPCPMDQGSCESLPGFKGKEHESPTR